MDSANQLVAAQAHAVADSLASLPTTGSEKYSIQGEVLVADPELLVVRVTWAEGAQMVVTRTPRTLMGLMDEMSAPAVVDLIVGATAADGYRIEAALSVPVRSSDFKKLLDETLQAALARYETPAQTQPASTTLAVAPVELK